MILLKIHFNPKCNIWEFLIIFQNYLKVMLRGGNTIYEIIFSDYARKDDLINYYNKSMHVTTTTNPIDMGGHRITSLADPTEDTDGINRSFLNKRISTATKNLKSEISTTISDLTKTNNEKVNEFEAKITRGATDLSEIQKNLTTHIKCITDTFNNLNKKDTVTADEIKK